MNKKEAEKALNKLQLEVNKLRDIIDAPESLFDITTYTEVCKRLNITEKSLSEFETLKEYRYHQILNIQKLFNEDAVNPRWYPWFSRTGSGLVFFISSCFSDCYYGQVAYFKDKKTSDYIGKTFKFIYNDLK